MYVVEWFGELYGPFWSERDATAFRPSVRTENAFAVGKVRKVLSIEGDAQGNAIRDGYFNPN